MPEGTPQNQNIDPDVGFDIDSYLSDYEQPTNQPTQNIDPDVGFDIDSYVSGFQAPTEPQLKLDPKDEERYEVGKYNKEGLMFNIMAEQAYDDDIAKSTLQAISMSPNSEELLNKMRANIKRKAGWREGLPYVGKRAVSMLPFVQLDWQKHAPTALEKAFVSDRKLAGDMYDPSMAFHVPVPGGGSIDLGDIADLTTTIGEFAIIGMATATPFKLAMGGLKKSKPLSGAVKFFSSTPRRKALVTRVAKSNVDFGIHNFTSLHPEDRAEGADLKDKLMARVKRIPATAVNASLFGALGSFENTFAQYGGVFTAGYTTTFGDMIKEMRKHGKVDYEKANKEAMKSGFLLAGAHFANVLGDKGINKFKEWGREKGLSETAIIDLSRSLVIDKKINEKERWRSKGIKRKGGVSQREVIIEGEKDVRGKPSYILRDTETDKTHTMTKGKFHDTFIRAASAAEKSKVRSRKIIKVKKLQRELDFDKAGHQEQNLKQEVFETDKKDVLETREWRITEKKVDPLTRVGRRMLGDWQKLFENNKISIDQVSFKDIYQIAKSLGIELKRNTKQSAFDAVQDYWAPKRIRYYQDIDKMTTTELKNILERNNIEVPARATKDQIKNTIKNNVGFEKGKRISWTDANTQQLDKAITKLQTEADVKRVLEDIKHGVYQGDLKSIGSKMFDDPLHAIRAIDKVIEKYDGELRLGEYRASELVKEADTILRENNITEEQQRKIILAAANRDGKKENHPAPQDLTEKEYKVYEFYTETLEQLGVNAMREGSIEDMVENYFVGLYQKQMPSAVQTTWGKIKSKLFGKTVEDVDLFKAETIGQKATLPTKSKFSLQKLITTPLDVEGTTLKPNYNIKDHLGEWYISTSRSMANRKLAEMIVDSPLASGKLTISTKQIPGYHRIVNKPLYQALTGKAREQAVWVHPKIGKSLEIIYNNNPMSAQMGAFRKIENFFKRIIMINPLIHGWNIYSDLMDEHNFRFIHAGKVALKGEDPRTVVRLVEGLEKKEVSKMSKQEISERFDRILDEMAGEGVPIAEIAQMTSELSNKANTHFSELGSTFWEKVNKSMQKEGFGAKASGIGRATRQWSDDFLWGKIVKNSMVSVYSIQKSKALKHGLSETDSRQAASHYTKDLLGMLPKHVFSKSGLLSSEALNHFFFARNWTVSNLRLVTGMLGYRGTGTGGAGFDPRLLQHRGLNKKQMDFLQGEYAKHLIKGVIGLVATNNILNWMMTSTVEVDDKGQFKEFKIDPSKGRFAFENPPEKYLDAYTGMKDNKGLDIYLVNPLFRYIGDYFSWYKDPTRTIFNKMHPLPKTSMELLANRAFWSGKQIVKFPKYDINKTRKYIEHGLYGLTPAGQFVDRPGVFRPFLERLLPFLGTWVRHGIAGDDENLTYGSKMNEYMREKRYHLDEVDQIIKKMLVTGADFDIIKEYILDKKRYKTAEAIINRLNKYRSPLVYKWDVLMKRKEDKIKFLQTLTPYERKDFLDKMRRVRVQIGEERRREREAKATP